MPKTSEVYEKLYHYTNWAGLLGIIENQTLWATHYKFLNDYSEIVLFRDILISFILPHVQKAYKKLINKSPNSEQRINQAGGLGKLVQLDAEVFVEALYRATGGEIYILSFCGQHENPNINSNGQLSQWRSYGAGGGFALIFDTQKLEEILALEAERFQYSAVHISDLIYSDDEKKLKEELSDDLSIIDAKVKQFFDNANLSKNEEADTLKSYNSFVQCITRYKHNGFREENEVRVVALPTVLDQKYLKLASSNGVTLKPEKERKFRKKNEQHIPYIELFNSNNIDLPIEKIIVGPHKEKETRASALRVMLRKTKIKITCSDIPYVGE